MTRIDAYLSTASTENTNVSAISVEGPGLRVFIPAILSDLRTLSIFKSNEANCI